MLFIKARSCTLIQKYTHVFLYCLASLLTCTTFYAWLIQRSTSGHIHRLRLPKRRPSLMSLFALLTSVILLRDVTTTLLSQLCSAVRDRVPVLSHSCAGDGQRRPPLSRRGPAQGGVAVGRWVTRSSVPNAINATFKRRCISA